MSARSSRPGAAEGTASRPTTQAEQTHRSLGDSITDDFCESFTKDSDYVGPVAGLIADGFLPEGVDPDDERVIAIVRKCQEARAE